MKYSLKIKLRTDIQPDVNGECYIYFVYWYERKRLYIPSQLKINPSAWDVDNQRPKPTYKNYKEIRETLRLKQDEVETKIFQFHTKNKSYPSTIELKELLKAKPKKEEGPKKKQKNKLSHFWNEYIEDQKLHKVRPATLEVYRQTWMKWQSFEKSKNTEYTYQDVNFNLLDRFKTYLLSFGYQKNTRGKAIKTMKAFFNFLHSKLELPISIGFKEVTVEKEEVEIVILKREELELLKRETLYSEYPNYRMPELQLTERQLLIGRILVFLCHTGLAFVDFDSLRLKHLVLLKNEKEKNLDLQLILTRTKVENARCVIPILNGTIDIVLTYLGITYATSIDDYRNLTYQQKTQILKEFLEKGFAEGKLTMETRIFPPVLSQKFNSEIKELLKIIGIDSMVSVIKFKGKKKEESLLPKYELISSITGRRTYVSLSYANGNDPMIIMETTGHKKYETLKRYNQISKEQVQEKIKQNTPVYK
jgi:hypothetical protein